MNKKVAAFIITLAMVVSFIPQTVFALVSYDLRVAGIQVTGEGAVTGSGINGSVTYTPASHTLTLNGATITAPGDEGDEYSGIYNGTDPLTIHLIGENIISKTRGSEWRNALYTRGLLTITAEPGASLILTTEGGAGGNYGISAHKDLTITGGDITAIGGNSGNSDEISGSVSYGIFVENGKLEISGGSVTAVANGTDLSKGSKSFGIFCDVGNEGNNQVDGAGNININNAIVSATGGAAETSGGIGSKYHLNISGDATVTAVGGDAVETDDNIERNREIPRSFGLGCADMGSITIQDSTVIATGGNFSFNGKTGDVTNQIGRSCGIYCGHAMNGVITFRNCVVVARAGTVDGEYHSAENMRCAVFNLNSKTNLSETAIKLDGTQIAGAAGYGSAGLEMLQNAGIVTVRDYAVNFDSFPPTENFPSRTAIGISPANEPQNAANGTGATGVVIVPDGWETTAALCEFPESKTLSNSGTAIVNIRENALTVADGIKINTAGYPLAAVSLYEGTESTAGITSNGSFTLSGGGKVIAVGGMTNDGDSYGVKNPEVQGNAIVNAATLTAYGFSLAMNAEPVLNKASKEVAVMVFPAEHESFGIDGSQLMKILPIYPIKVNDVQVTGLNETNVLGDGTVHYDPRTATLILNGATVNGISSEGGNLNLTLTGTNAINKDKATNVIISNFL